MLLLLLLLLLLLYFATHVLAMHGIISHAQTALTRATNRLTSVRASVRLFVGPSALPITLAPDHLRVRSTIPPIHAPAHSLTARPFDCVPAQSMVTMQSLIPPAHRVVRPTAQCQVVWIPKRWKLSRGGAA